MILGLLDQGNNLIKAKALTLTSSNNDTVITISGSASTLVYEEILQNIVLKVIHFLIVLIEL